MSQNEISKQYFMKEALKLAKKALSEGEVPVGCVFVYNNEIIGSGYNQTVQTRNATRHCEMVAIDQILEKYDSKIFSNCTLYVTVEPCIMCAAALLILGVKVVYCGCKNERFGGCGSVYQVNTIQTPMYKTYECHSGIFEKEAIELLQTFYNQENPLAPNPKKKKKNSI